MTEQGRKREEVAHSVCAGMPNPEMVISGPRYKQWFVSVTVVCPDLQVIELYLLRSGRWHVMAVDRDTDGYFPSEESALAAIRENAEASP